MIVLIPQIGIETYSVFEGEHREPVLPAPHALLPDGKPVEKHLAKLFNLRPTGEYLEDFIRPRFDTQLLRPARYRRLRESTRKALHDRCATTSERTDATAEDCARINAAIALLGEMELDHKLLTIGQSLLHRA